MEYHVYLLLKISCLEILGNGNHGLFLSQKLMEIWYLLITEKFLFWTFSRWEIRSFFEPKNWWKMIFIKYWKVLVSNFMVMGNTVFLSAKKWMEKWYLIGLSELPMIFQDLGNMVFCVVWMLRNSALKNTKLT